MFIKFLFILCFFNGLHYLYSILSSQSGLILGFVLFSAVSTQYTHRDDEIFIGTKGKDFSRTMTILILLDRKW